MMLSPTAPCQGLEIKQLINDSLAADLYKKPQASLADGMLGVLTSQSLKAADISPGLRLYEFYPTKMKVLLGRSLPEARKFPENNVRIKNK